MLDVNQRVLGEAHPKTMLAMNSLAIVYKNLGKYEEALNLTNKLIEQSKSVLGAEHPHTIGFINNLALIYRKLGKNEEASELLNRE